MSATQTGDIAVRATHLEKTYTSGFFRRKIHAVVDVSLEVHRGEIFGLLGPNGAGKTTTIKAMLGLIRPSSGSIELLGRPVGDLSTKRKLGYLPESPYFYDYLTGREFLVFIGQLFGFSRKDSHARAETLLDRVGMTETADRTLRRYSKGMLQRIGLAQALINDPELIVLDEPLTGLDPVGRKQLRTVIAELGKAGKTVILCSHVLSDVEQLADRVAILAGGRTVQAGPLASVVAAQTVNVELLVAGPFEAVQTAFAAHAQYTLSTPGELLRIEFNDVNAIDATLDRLRAAGGKLVSLTPRKESLEDVVVRWAQSSNTTDDSRHQDNAS